MPSTPAHSFQPMANHVSQRGHFLFKSLLHLALGRRGRLESLFAYGSTLRQYFNTVKYQGSAKRTRRRRSSPSHSYSSQRLKKFMPLVGY
jgi:hypothetical protein